MIRFIIFIFLLITTNFYGQSTILKVDPSLQYALPDSTVSVNISIQNVTDLHAYTFQLDFDPNLLKVQSFNNLEFFSGNQTLLFHQIDSNSGFISFDEAILGPSTVSGSGGLIQVEFKAKIPGSSLLTFSNFSFRDGDNQIISVDTIGGRIDIDISSSIENNEKEQFINNFNVFPNPFNISTSIYYSLNESRFVSIKLFDILGNEIQTLFYGHNSAGKHTLLINASNLTSGVYFCTLIADKHIESKKLVLIK